MDTQGLNLLLLYIEQHIRTFAGRMQATTWTGDWKCLESTSRQKTICYERTRQEATGVNRWKDRLWNRVQCWLETVGIGWQDALLLNKGELDTSVFAGDRQWSTVMG